MEFAAGCFGGMCGVLVSHPLDTLRTQQDISGQSWRKAARSSLKHGIPTLYLGVISPCISVGVWKAVTLGVYAQLKSRLAKVKELDSVDQLPLVDVTLTACVAGSISASVCTPFELVKTHTMLRATPQRSSSSSSSSSSAMDIIRQEIKQLSRVVSKPGGVSNLFRGLHLLLLRDSYATGVFLGR